MGFRNIEGMLDELALIDFESTKTAELVKNLYAQNYEFTEAQLSYIVNLYNLHCIPKKWENDSIPSKPKKRKHK